MATNSLKEKYTCVNRRCAGIQSRLIGAAFLFLPGIITAVPVGEFFVGVNHYLFDFTGGGDAESPFRTALPHFYR